MHTTYRVVAISVTAMLAASAGAQISFDATAYSTPSQPDGVTAADFNGDGHDDLAVTTDAPDKITLLLGDGTGSFAQGGTIQTGGGTGPGFIVAADMDGDTDPDLVVALKNIDTVRVYINNGGVFAQGASAGVGDEPRGIFVADFDGDQDMDAATANRESNNVSILLNQGGFLSVSTVGVGQEPRMITGGALIPGGGVDLAVTNHDDRTISLLSNNGSGGFSVTDTLFVNPTTRPEGIAAADMDGDGDVDLVAATNDDNLNFASVFLNQGGDFTGPFDYSAPGGEADQVAVADFDGDEDVDVLLSNDNTSNVVPMENTGSGALASRTPVAVGTTPGTIAIGTFDSNASPDAAVATRDSNQTWVLINGVEFGCVADFNGDGMLNILDFVAFQAAFVDGDPSADINGDGMLNILDFVAFQGVFQQGCP